MPWRDWQFWIVSLAALWGLWALARELVPSRGGEEAPCSNCSVADSVRSALEESEPHSRSDEQTVN